MQRRGRHLDRWVGGHWRQAPCPRGWPWRPTTIRQSPWLRPPGEGPTAERGTTMHVPQWNVPGGGCLDLEQGGLLVPAVERVPEGTQIRGSSECPGRDFLVIGGSGCPSLERLRSRSDEWEVHDICNFHCWAGPSLSAGDSAASVSGQSCRRPVPSRRSAPRRYRQTLMCWDLFQRSGERNVSNAQADALPSQRDAVTSALAKVRPRWSCLTLK